MSDTLQVTLITAAVAVLAPMFLSYLNGKQLARATELANKRTDVMDERARLRAEVAANKLEESARLLVQNQRDVSDKSDETARVLVVSQAEVARRAEEAAADARHRAEETARLLLESQKEAAVKADAAAVLLRETADTTKIVHTLVNSEYTRARRTELESIGRELVLLREVSALHKRDGAENGKASKVAIEVAEKRYAELKVELAEREKQDEVVKLQREAQVKGTAEPA